MWVLFRDFGNRMCTNKSILLAHDLSGGGARLVLGLTVNETAYWVIVVLALSAGATVAGVELRAARPGWRSRRGSSIWLAGRNHTSESVAGEIYARALALDDGAGGRAVLIAIDLAGLRGA